MESVENNNKVEPYISRAIETNEDFLTELADTHSLEELREILHDLAFVTEVDNVRRSVIPEVTHVSGSEDSEVAIYDEEDILRGLNVYINDPVTKLEGLEEEVRGWIPHRDIADAVIRIITDKINETETT
jgi:hypothetical protein